MLLNGARSAVDSIGQRQGDSHGIGQPDPELDDRDEWPRSDEILPGVSMTEVLAGLALWFASRAFSRANA
jgi:hypothetical protein